MIPGDRKIPGYNCLCCGYHMDMTAPVDGTAIPKDGDVTICIRCGDVGIFNADFSVRAPRLKELQEIMRSRVGKVIRSARQKIRETRAEMN